MFPANLWYRQIMGNISIKTEGGKGLINNTGNSDFQTIILFMETPGFDKMSFAVTAWEKLLGQSVKVFLKRVNSESER